MLAYLERAETHNAFMANEIYEYEIGKRHLANMMGVNPDEFTQEDIDAAIEYLLPSGIFDKRARPKMKHPTEAIPARKAAQFGFDGRPFHCFFYTGKPNYVQTMHDLAWKLEALKGLDVAHKATALENPSEKLILTGSQWLDKNAVQSLLQEALSDNEYQGLINVLEFMCQQSRALEEKEAIFKFRKYFQSQSYHKELDPVKQSEDGRSYQEASGMRREARASVKLFESGTGEAVINGHEILQYFPRLVDRKQIMFPLHFTDKLGVVDFEATVKGGGPSGQAGAIRLALSTALQRYVDKGTNEKMRLAGLLTRDPRTVERQKPGMQGARRRYTWKKR
jgi:small subunit ribosomal protein S9